MLLTGTYLEDLYVDRAFRSSMIWNGYKQKKVNWELAQ